MTSETARSAFDALVPVIVTDEEGVGLDGDTLLVHGEPFAELDGDDLVVDLPAARAADLAERGIAQPAGAGAGGGTRVRVADLDLWEELAREAHDFVGEPRAGGES
jgi:hypothetical protein